MYAYKSCMFIIIIRFHVNRSNRLEDRVCTDRQTERPTDRHTFYPLSSSDLINFHSGT